MAVKTIHNPGANAVNIIVEPGETIAFDFDLSNADFERTGDNLVISLDNGGQVVLDNFFVADDLASLPPLQLADGTQVNSGDFLAALDVDVTPAAGSAASGGLNAYDDNAGSLINGLDLSESLGSTQWGGAAATEEVYEGLSNPGLTGEPGAPPPPTGGRGFSTDYLAVFYAGPYNSASTPTAAAFNINLPGAVDGDAIIVTSDNGYIEDGSLTYVDGKWTLTASVDGLAAMQNGGGADVKDTITVEYGGNYYTIHVVLTYNDGFKSLDASNDYIDGKYFAGEWYTADRAVGRSDEIYYLSDDNIASEVWLKGINATTNSNTIHTYEGSETPASAIHVESSVIATGGNSNTLTTGQGADNYITVGANVKVSMDSTNTLTSGNIIVNAHSDEGAVINNSGLNELNAAFDVTLTDGKTGDYDGAYGMVAHQNDGKVSLNLISAGEDIYIKASAEGVGADAYGVKAEGDGAENRLEAGLTVTIEANSEASDSFAMYASGKGLNVITLTGGADGQSGGAVNLKGDIHADTGGQNIINGSAGDDVFTLNGAVSGADALIIHGNDGSDKLVLMAADYNEFVSNYQDWLTAAAGDPDIMSGIESITVEIGELNAMDYDDLQIFMEGNYPGMVDYLVSSEFVFGTRANIVELETDYISGGLGEQSINIAMPSGAYSLSDLADSINGFEQIDMTGGSWGNMLNIDSLLDDLKIDTGLDATRLTSTLGSDLTDDGATVLRITGDSTDTVSFGGDWISASVGTATYDGVTYNVYTNDADATQFLLIQSGVGIM